MQWDPGDGSDTLEGQENRDTLRFNGSNINEITELSANGGRVLMSRNVASIVMDLNDVEVVEHNALGGADTTTINDLSGADVTEVREDLALGGGGDGEADQVVVNATNGDDTIAIRGSAAAGVDVLGLVPRVKIRNQEPSLDRLFLHTLAGADIVRTNGLAPSSIGLAIDSTPEGATPRGPGGGPSGGPSRGAPVSRGAAHAAHGERAEHDQQPSQREQPGPRLRPRDRAGRSPGGRLEDVRDRVESAIGEPARSSSIGA